MREMKDSGIAWVGEIPKEWEIGRIGGLYELRNQKVSDKDFIPLSVTMKGILPQLETAAKTNDGDNRKLVRKGDFAINSRSDRRGSCGISDYDGSVSLINTILKPRNQMNARYYNWLFHTPLFADEFYKWGHGIVDDLWTTNWGEMKKISIPAPSLNEQQRIAEFLDRACGKIDGLKADIQAQIDTLEQYKRSVITEAVTHGLNPSAPMKDSGIPWVGEIPNEWSVNRAKYCFVNTKEIAGCRSDRYERLALTMNGVIKRSKDDSNGLQPEKFETYQILRPDELVFKLIDLQNVSTSRVGLSPYLGLVSPAYIILKSNKRVLPTFAEKYFLMLWKNQIFNALGDAGVRSNLNSKDLLELSIPLPPLDEQQEIADYLDNKCAEIEQIIADKKTQIETLDGYKKSLIYEYVTGKKEVV